MVAIAERVTSKQRPVLFDVAVDALDFESTIDRCRALAHDGGVHQHVVLNAAKVVAMQDDRELASIIRSCSLVNADGASVVWASRLLRRPLPERVAGIDLFVKLIETAANDGDSVFFLGARAEVVTKVAEVFKDRFPTLDVAGTHDGYWDDDGRLIAAIRAARPTYLFLAIPSPRKEFWLNRNLHALGVPFVMGVGGSFDVVAGVTTRAPRWMQRVGMEWSWRLIQEPRRMFKRYLVGNSRFLAITAREWIDGLVPTGKARR